MDSRWEVSVPKKDLPSYEKNLSFGLYAASDEDFRPFVSDVANLDGSDGNSGSFSGITYDGMYGDWSDYPHDTIEYATSGTQEERVDAKGALYYQGEGKIFGHVVTQMKAHRQEHGGEFAYSVTIRVNKDKDKVFYPRLVAVDPSGNINWDPSFTKDGTYEYYISNRPDLIGVVTADSDGQHTPEDIEKTARALFDHPDSLILGSRQFEGGGVPWKSRTGNKLTKKIFRYITGVSVSDTQTGLRGIPREFMKEIIGFKSDGFDLETNILLASVGNYPIVEIPIETVYDSRENHNTHFHPVFDSAKIYLALGKQFVKYFFSSITSSAIDLAVFTLLCFILKGSEPGLYIAISTVIARAISAVYNFIINYKVVFYSHEKIAASGFRYFVLAVVQMSASAVLVTLLSKIAFFLPDTVTKIIVDTGLFFVSCYIQQRYVFHRMGRD